MTKTNKKNQPYTRKLQGVAALLGEGNDSQSSKASKLGAMSVAIPLIKLPLYQPRRYFDPNKLQELSRSIKTLGILEPLLVRPTSEGNYELVAGERRFKAAQMAQLNEVPVIVREMDDTMTHTVRLIENLQREDLNPLEETEGILELLALRLETNQTEAIKLLQKMENEVKGKITPNVMGSPQGLIIEELFSTLGRMKWDSFVKNRLPLLKLPPDVLEVLRQGKLEYTKGRALAKVKDEQKRYVLIEAAITENLSLSQINERIKVIPRSTASKNPLKERYKQALPRLQKSKVWDNPKKKKALEKLLSTIESLIEE